MPNWVYNRVHGSKKACELLLGKDRLPTFTNIVPIPEELKTIEGLSDSTVYEALVKALFENDSAELKNLFYSRKLDEKYSSFSSWIEDLQKQYPIDKLMAVQSLKDKYGVADWYNFNCKYFGCKWDASSLGDTPYEADVDEIEFETPWSPPEEVMRKLATLIPDEEFTWHCDEESCAFSFDAIYDGTGTYKEVDVFPEYYTPYIPEENDLSSYLNKITDAKTLIKEIKDYLPDQCVYDLVQNKKEKTITITVYDWDVYGGDELYTHTFENINFKEEK